MRVGHLLFVIAAGTVLAADQVTKNAVVRSLPEGTERPALDHILFIQHLQNPCAAFNLCGGVGSPVFLAFAVVVSIGLVIYEFRPPAHPAWSSLVLGMVLGGVLGNAVDRLLHGSVTDFLAVHWFPTFNLADSAISVGVVILALGYGLRRQPVGA